MIPDIYVLRHGETAWNLEGRMQGRRDSPLTARGRAQAAAQGAALRAAGLAGLPARVSPQGRAQETARLALPGPACSDPRLAEIDMGLWTGKTRAEIFGAAESAADWGGAWSWYRTIPEGETLEALEARCAAVLAELTGPTLLVTHGVTSQMLRALALGGSSLDDLPGGQGIVHGVVGGTHITLP